MATGKINTGKTASGKIEVQTSTTGKMTSGGVTDHNRLFNRDAADQHPISSIIGLTKQLENKLDADTALPLIEDATKGKARGLFFDAAKEFAKKSYWYLTAEVDPRTGQGTKDSIISGPYDLGAGGGSGGGGGGITTVSIKPHIWSSTVVVGAKTLVSINWTSTMGEDKEPTGDGTIYVSVNDKQVLVLPNKAQGIVEFDLSNYLAAGANNIQVRVIDAYGTAGILVRTTMAITLELKSTFNSNLNYTDFINYNYIPYGDVDKTVYFIVDGKQHGTQVVKSTGEQQTYRIQNLTHGSHTLEVYFKADINGEKVTSNSLFYDLVYYVSENTTPIIVSTFNKLEQEQYIAFNIPYRVYIDGRNEFEVSFLVNDEEINKTTVGTSEQYWNYINNIPGNYKLTIKCGEITKDFNIYIKPSTIKVTPVAQDLVLALNTQGRNNNEESSIRSQWVDSTNNISCELTNFNWKSNGWVSDIDGNTILRVSGDARIKIPFKPFAEDFKNYGKTIELEIATSAVRNYSTTLISCLDKQSTDFFEAEASFVDLDFRANIFKVNLDVTKLKASGITTGTHVFSYTANGWFLDSEQEVELSTYGISISKDTVNPEGTHPDDFLLVGDNIIVEYTLAARGFYVTPQIAAFRSQQSVISTQYKEDEHVRLAFVVEKNTDNRIIWMYINGIASGAMQYPVDDSFRQLDPNIIEIGSNDAILDIYNIRIYDNNLTSKQIVNNWIADTQDIALKAARFSRNDNYNDKNEIIMSKLPTDLPYIIWDIQPLPEFKGDKRLGNAVYVDPTDSTRNFTSERAQYNVQGTSSSVYPTKNIRIKFKAKDGDPNFSWVDDNGDNIKKFPITYPGGIGDNYFTFKVDYASSEGANNVELTKLYNDTCIELGILTPPQRKNLKVRVGIDGFPIAAFYRDEEGKDVFWTKANFNNDKANEDVYGFEDGDESWETTNNSADETKYKIPSGPDNFENGFEIRYPDSDDWNGDTSKLEAMTTWVASTNRELATNEELPEPVTYTYIETTLGEDNSESSKEVTKTFTHDTAEYRLIKFRYELPDWFNVDSTLFYYVFTHLYLMIDSRAKNAFPTYFASREAGDGGDKWFWIPYDMDTAIGIDNKGKLSFDYNLEDTDQLDGADVYNGQDSVMWCNLRDSMPGEIKAMYAKMRLSGLISYEETDKRFEAHQGKWSESIFNEDAKNKYITPLANGDNYLEMLQGSKSQQRKWWLYNRFKYMDSKYNAGEAIKDFIQFRAYVDSGVEKPNIVITPYADIYATVSYANGRIVAKRAKRNEPITIVNPFGTAETENDQETYIYSASQLKSIGDISGFKPDTVKIGNAIKLQDLKVGDKDPSYENPHLKELTVGSNTLLKTIDARNCINLGTGTTSAPDISQCINIEEIYFTGTKIKGIVLPDGGNIKKLHLPGTLTSLTIKNQPLLTDLNIEGTNTTLNIPVVNQDNYTIVGKVISKTDWSDALGLADLLLSDGEAEINLTLTDQDLYNSIELNSTALVINCKQIDVRYDLIDNSIVELVDYKIAEINTITLNKDNLLYSVKPAIDFANANVKVPTIEDYGMSLIESLWLENIPSSSIKPERMVSKMQPNTAVRLIGINENYNSYEEIAHFYSLLDTKKGLTSDGEIVNRAQITGTINIDTISYANYVKLTNWYPEVKINTKQIICTLIFKNENAIHHTKNVVLGNTTSAPEIPLKTSTQKNYYVFEYWTYNSGEIWTSDTIIKSDLIINAVYSEHLQKYTITFNPASDLISVEPISVTQEYGTEILEPILSGIPEGVTLDGWYDTLGNKWIFTGDYSNKVLKHETLTAKWTDLNAPTVNIKPINFNEFEYTASDNLGITGWAVVRNSNAKPSVWNVVDAKTTISGSYKIDNYGTYYFWITDSNSNTAVASLVSYPIIVKTTPGIENYTIAEADDLEVETFAINGSVVTLVAELDSHYENLEIVVNNEIVVNGYTFEVNKQINIDLSCTPKDYTVTFDLRDKGDYEKATDQTITYLHYVEKPQAQYYQKTGEVIDSWYLDTAFEAKWDFEKDQVEGDMILYAKWVPYHMPTIITIQVPEGTEAQRTIVLCYSQVDIDNEHKVIIDWGDGSAKASSLEDIENIHMSHTYEPGTYKINLLGPGGGTTARYMPGDGYSWQLVNPSSYITDIDFSWDLEKVAHYALMGSSIKDAKISEYMSTISTGCYANCKNITSLDIPDNIIVIEDQAFSGCSNIKGKITIPHNLIKLGNNVFDYCESIEELEMLVGENFNWVDIQLYSGTSTNIFRSCNSLKTINISPNILLVQGMFSYCSGLEEINISNDIADKVFIGCTNLAKATLASHTIGKHAFFECTNLEKVYLLDPEAELAAYAFDRCAGLSTVGPLSTNIDDSPYNFNFAWKAKIPNHAFARSWDTPDMTSLPFAQNDIKEVTLPETIIEIGDYAFQNATKLKKIIFPEGLEVIGEGAFEACTLLTSLNIPVSVIDIKPLAFYACTALTKVNIEARSNLSAESLESPNNAWFLGTNSSLMLYIPSIIVNGNQVLPEDRYGKYWNAYTVNSITGKITYLSYIIVDEEIE